jgi:hyperosmotically inducible protein
MKIGNSIKLGVSLICALFISNSMAAQSREFKIATVMGTEESSKSTPKDAKSTKESTASKDMSATKEYLSDSELTAKVKEKFIQEKLMGKDKISAMGIHVKTKKAVVTLSGKVSSQDEIDTAVKLAKSVDGVKDVVSNIKVKATKKDAKAEKSK